MNRRRFIGKLDEESGMLVHYDAYCDRAVVEKSPGERTVVTSAIGFCLENSVEHWSLRYIHRGVRLRRCVRLRWSLLTYSPAIT